MGKSRVEESEFNREMEQIWVIALSSLLLLMRAEPGQRIRCSQKFDDKAKGKEGYREAKNIISDM